MPIRPRPLNHSSDRLNRVRDLLTTCLNNLVMAEDHVCLRLRQVNDDFAGSAMASELAFTMDLRSTTSRISPRVCSAMAGPAPAFETVPVLPFT